MIVEVVNENTWKHSLENRNHLKAFGIPKRIVENQSIKDGTKRKFIIEISSGKKFEGTFTITSGEEIHFPKSFTGYLENQKSFTAQVIDKKIYDIVDFQEIK